MTLQPKQSAGFYDPRCGDEAIQWERLEMEGPVWEPLRTNCFSVYLIESGRGTFWADSARFAFAAQTLLFFVPYQQIRFETNGPVRGSVIRFHANFLCVETFHAEVGCSGLLFNDPVGVPVVPFERSGFAEVNQIAHRLVGELTDEHLAYREAVLLHMKWLLILATRQKLLQAPAGSTPGTDPRHPLLVEFRELLEQHYSTLHSPSEYARLLHVSAKSLGKVVRDHLGTTPTKVIRSRVLTHAKWQLLHTLRPVKEIAAEVGFADELYFSRMFRKATGHSPTAFREFETEIRGGSNLSMQFASAPIPENASTLDAVHRTEQEH